MLKKYKLTKTILLSIFSILIISCGAKKKVEVAKPKTQKQLNVISTGKLFQESLDLIKQQKYQEAITPLEKIITVEKKLPRVYFNLGLCYHRLNRFNKAYNFYITSLNLEPELINSLVNLVDIATPLKKEVKVLKRLDNFLSKKGNEFNVTILNAKAVLFSNQKKYKSASQSIRKALSRTPEDKKSLRNLSTIYYQQGKYVMAGTILGNLLGKHKELAKDSGLWNNLGMIQMKMGEKKKGLSNFRTAYELDPKNITTLKNLASFSLKYRDYKKSIERYNKVIAIDSVDSEAISGLAFSFFAIGNADKALGQLGKLMELEKSKNSELYKEAILLTAQTNFSLKNDRSAAKKYFSQYLKFAGLNPNKRKKAQENLNQINQILNQEKEYARQEAEQKKLQKEKPAPAPAEEKGQSENEVKGQPQTQNKQAPKS